MPTKHPRPGRRTSPSVPGGARELDALESLGEAFGEASEHAARAPEFHAVRLGPLEELPMSSLWPGEFGWQRTVAAHDGRSTGRLLWLLLPGSESNPENALTPLPGQDRTSYAFLEVLSGPPWRILAATATDATGSSMLKAFATTVARELRAE